MVEVSFYISTTWWVSLLVDQWVPEGTCSQVLRSTSVDSWGLRASKSSVIKLFEIVILWVYYTIPFGFSLFWHVWDISFQLLKLLLWLRTTDEGSVPEMRIWSILLIKSDLKWCIHLGRSLFLYLNRVTKKGPEGNFLSKCLFFDFLNVNYLKFNLWNSELSYFHNKLSRGS